jgi:hypothetical protein
LALQLEDRRVVTEEWIDLSGYWTNPHRLGGFDVCVVADDWRLRVCAETKWCDKRILHEALWDYLKLGPASSLASVEAAYMIAAAPESRWAPSSSCSDLLNSAEHEVSVLLHEHLALWQACLLGNKSCRPHRIPARLAVSQVADVPFELPKARWRLRVASVRAVGDGVLRFDDDGLPARVESA